MDTKLVVFFAVSAVLTSGPALISAQCNFPNKWYNPDAYYFTQYTSSPQLLLMNISTWGDLSTAVVSSCNAVQLTPEAPDMAVISFTTDSNKKYCVEAIYEETAFFVRSTSEITRDAPYTVDECITALGPRTEFKAFIKYLFNEAEWEETLPVGLPEGSYGFTFSNYNVISGQETGCVDANAKLTVTRNEWVTTSTCLTGPQTYTNPFVGLLKVVAGLPDAELSIDSGSSSSGMVIVAMDNTNTAITIDYQFFIMRYSVTTNDDQSSSLDLFFTTGSPANPTGYIDMSLVPDTERNSIKRASLKSSECLTAACNNGGTCIQQWRMYTCKCAAGYEGTNCDVNTDDCAAGPCLNGGVCTDLVNAFSCECETGWAGATCSFDDRCDPDPCDNGGSCFPASDDYVCLCPDGFFGQDCERENLCQKEDEPCENGGTCLFNHVSYYCECPIGFLGLRCEVYNGTSCDEDSCENDGVCVVTSTGAYCQCTIYYEGELCEALRDWFIIALVLLCLLVIILVILLIVACCYCCCGWRPNNGADYTTMENSVSSLRLDSQSPGTVEFNFSPASPYYGIQMVK